MFNCGQVILIITSLFKWRSYSSGACQEMKVHHHSCSLASSVCAIRETTQEQGNMVLLARVVYSEDNLRQNNKQKRVLSAG